MRRAAAGEGELTRSFSRASESVSWRRRRKLQDALKNRVKIGGGVAAARAEGAERRRRRRGSTMRSELIGQLKEVDSRVQTAIGGD